MKEHLLGILVVVAGLVLFTRGVYMAWKPGGWMVAGALLASPAFFALYGKIRFKD